MATITAIISATGGTTQVDVTITSTTVISDPIAYVQLSAVQTEILARAGLSATLSFVSATLQSSMSVGSTYYYSVLVTYGDTPDSTTTHYHDHTTVTMPLRESYRDGPTVDLSTSLGPVTITATDDVSVDYLRIRTDLGTTARDLLWVKQSSVIRFGAHTEFYLDATYDVGTPDEGATLRRPRDVRLSRDLYAGRNVLVTGYGTYGTYVLGTHYRFTGQATNPDTASVDRHLYVNSVDASLRYWDGSSETVLSGGAGAGSDTVGLYDCPGGVAVGNVVHVTSNNYVVPSNAATLAGKDIMGVVVSKPTATTAYVKYVGEASVFVGLVAGETYFVAKVDGAVTNDVSAYVEGDTQTVVGVAKNATTLVLRISAAFDV